MLNHGKAFVRRRLGRVLRFLAGGVLLSLLSAVAWKGRVLYDARLELETPTLRPGEELVLSVEGEPGTLPVLLAHDPGDPTGDEPILEWTLPPIPFEGPLVARLRPEFLPSSTCRLEVRLRDPDTGLELARSNSERLEVLDPAPLQDRRMHLGYRGAAEAFVEVLPTGVPLDGAPLWSGFLTRGETIDFELPAGATGAALLVDGVQVGDLVPGASRIPGPFVDLR